MAGRLDWGALTVAIFATICMVVILFPLSSIILWSIILAVLFANTNERLSSRLNGRNRGALATLVLVLLTAIIPFVLTAVVLSGQLIELANDAEQVVANGSDTISGLIAALPDGLRAKAESTFGKIDDPVEKAIKYILPALSYSFSVGGNILIFVSSIFAVLYVTFFFLRDRKAIVGFMSAVMPLQEKQKSVLSARLADTMTATVRGVILVAAGQAVVAGVVYALLGIKFYAVLTAITFVGCLIPAVGSGLVWVPLTIYFFSTGQYTQGIIMALSGAFVISSVDSLLRPLLIGRKAALPGFLIFLSSIGGLVVAGFNGLFLGPIISAFFIESWKIYLDAGGSDLAAQDHVGTAESDAPD